MKNKPIVILNRQFTRQRLGLYLIPIIIGLGGIAFSQQLPNYTLRLIILSLSLAVPLFAGGNLLARYRTSRLERLLLLLGALMLAIGAGVSLSGVSETLQALEIFPEPLVGVSRLVGLASVLLGLFVVLFTVVRTREDIEEMGARFWHLAEHMTEGFVLSRNDGTIFLVNRQFLDMLDLTQEEVLGQKSTEIAQKLDLNEMAEHIGARSQGVSSGYEITWTVRGEERRFWFNGTPIMDRNGRHTATLATVRDITEQHRLAQRVERYADSLQDLVQEQTEKLMQSEQRFRQLLLSMNEGFLTVDTEGRIRFVNARFREMLGFREDQLLGRDVYDYVDAVGRMRLAPLLSSTEAAGRGGGRRELSFLDAAGKPVPSMVAATFVRQEGDQESSFSLVVTPMAEQKHMEEQLKERARQLEELNEELRLHDRAKDGFLSNVSHELRTPLSTVQGYVEMLLSGNMGELESPQADALRVMDRNLRRLVALITEMIEFSRMEIRGIQVSPRLFAPSRLVRHTLDSFLPQAKAKGVEIVYPKEGARGYAWGDDAKLSQVLGILLNNAIKFTEAGGSVRVELAERPGRTLAIRVRDTGIGIAPAYHDRVFQKFFQVDSSRTRRYEGAGIGLSIARNIVEAHQGTLELESAEGKGSVFTMVLPQAIIDMAVEPEETTHFEGFQILLVETGKDMVRALKEFFEETGCAIATSKSRFECLRTAEELQPDVIVLNAGADEGGAATIDLLRQHPATETIPIVLTGGPGTEAAGRAHTWEAVYLLPRPFRMQRFLRILRYACLGEEQYSSEVLSKTESTTSPVSVLVADADPGMREWIEAVLYRRNVPCSCAGSISQAIQLAKQLRPDLILVDADATAPDMAEQIAVLGNRSETRGAKIYLMSSRRAAPKEHPHVAGYLYKPFTAGELTELLLREASLRVPGKALPSNAKAEY